VHLNMHVAKNCQKNGSENYITPPSTQ
jgi:hypothetical protein